MKKMPQKMNRSGQPQTFYLYMTDDFFQTFRPKEEKNDILTLATKMVSLNEQISPYFQLREK